MQCDPILLGNDTTLRISTDVSLNHGESRRAIYVFAIDAEHVCPDACVIGKHKTADPIDESCKIV
jgi:hypothetical protein